MALTYSEKYDTEKVRVLSLVKNRGKGGAVRMVGVGGKWGAVRMVDVICVIVANLAFYILPDNGGRYSQEKERSVFNFRVLYMGNCQIKLQIGKISVPASYRSNLSM